MDINNLPEELIYYAKAHLNLSPLDAVYVKNLIIAALKVAEPASGTISKHRRDEIDAFTVPDELFNRVRDAALGQKLCDAGMEESFAAYIMGLLTPYPSTLSNKFNSLMRNQSPKSACDYLYDISIKNNYIQKTAIDKNLYWKADFGDSFIEITINLSKPEKDNKEIARMQQQPPSSYPPCVLCAENLGYSGNLAKAPRQNLRYIPITLASEEWFMQYSPYLYYDKHCIVVSMQHRPMTIDALTPRKLCDFVTLFPHYFVGSNASIPIVGGSILAHEHFQGGAHRMPVHYAADLKSYRSAKHPKVSFSMVDWYNSVVRMRSTDKEAMIQAAAEVISGWNDYNNPECGIISHTKAVGHNAITPIMRFEHGEYIFDAILRNNRTDDEHPDGIFHADKQYHNIKKEAIGLIEAMGMFILPGRLKGQIAAIADILTGNSDDTQGLEVHADMIEKLKQRCAAGITKGQAELLIKDYINDACKNILINTAVFKPDVSGRKAFSAFIEGFL